jgi:molecular chaperone DnaJ
MKNPNIHGDEYVTLQIDVPRNLSEREKALLRQLQSIEQQRSA